MAKKKAATATKGRRGRRKGSKSGAIRDHLAANPDAQPKEIVDALKAQGIDVTAPQVSQVKWAESKKGPTAKTAKRKGRRGRPPRAAASGTNGKSYESLLEAKKLVDKLGGVEAAKQALDILATLQK